MDKANIERWQDARTDCWRGTKDDLIAAGICKPEWFPAKLQPELRRDGTPRISHAGQGIRLKRTYRFPGGEVTCKLDAYGVERWIVRVPVSDEERARREEPYRRQYAEMEQRSREGGERQSAERDAKDREFSGREKERLGRLPTLIRRLAPFVPGSMSEAEKHHMRILRGLSEAQREHVMDMAERLLDLNDQQPSASNHGLRIVVDNGIEGGRD